MESTRWGDLNKVLYWEAPTRDPRTPNIFNTIFDRKDTPFVYLLWYSFHKPSLELYIPLTAANSLSFK